MAHGTTPLAPGAIPGHTWSMYGLVFLFAALVIGYLVFAVFSRGKEPPSEPSVPKRDKFCPLCGSPMAKSDNVHTVVYAVGEGDQLAEIHGCPACRPPRGTEPRSCPVCRQELGPDDVVHARYFVRPGRKHIHVLGCSRCYRRKR